MLISNETYKYILEAFSSTDHKVNRSLCEHEVRQVSNKIAIESSDFVVIKSIISARIDPNISKLSIEHLSDYRINSLLELSMYYRELERGYLYYTLSSTLNECDKKMGTISSKLDAY